MAVASSSATVVFGVLSSPKNLKSLCKFKPFLLPLLSHSPLTQSTLTFSARKNNPNSATTSSSKKKKNSSSNNSKSKKKQTLTKKSEVEVVDDIDEDAIEALFNQLEEDLKSDGSFADGDDDLTEEDLARLEKELKEAFGEDADLFEMLQLSEENIQNSDDAEDGEEDEEDEEEEEIDDDDDDDDEEESPVQLKNWQLRRLATALKIGRRKISIQTLAAELCLDRAVVLELLREPPPNLLMLSAALPDIVVPKPIEIEAKPIEVSTETVVDVSEPSVEASDGVVEPDPKVKVPVHALQSRWSAQKRLKKVQIETLERVYLRSKRPTNAMISSIVHVTNLPKKRVVKWFEDKRAEDGIAEDRLPYQRSKSETVSTS
ncbi:protein OVEREXPRESSOR OF CATIONIC PEROXIDASE 3-like isoform X1 [Papaver somniferum]|uniref:protein OVEREXPRESSOR OF CATIONIC PEROXIDASE 3-like isoform X1 n=1 Tax=Papaver somniferum TaxID=3469 RepID=UPI000E6FEB2D|nr:protein OVEREXPRESSOR OF CATIONIC PEROXIDASE 3-like isoform X1 [Papaver somniferum]